MLHSLANGCIFPQNFGQLKRKTNLNHLKTGFLSLLKIRCDVDFLGIMWRIALQYCLYSLGSFESVLSKIVFQQF